LQIALRDQRPFVLYPAAPHLTHLTSSSRPM
jgi:hypothetical protein